jgi:PilZ domain
MESPMSQVDQGPAARRWTRHKIDVRLKVSFRNEGETTSAFGRANSLSHGGIGAYIPCTIAVGTTVSLELTFPYSSMEAHLDAVVRTCEGFRYGLEFTRVSDAVREMIVKNCSGAELLQ